MSLNPDGAFFLGLKIGRRSAELVLIDFLGAVRARAPGLPTATRRRARPSRFVAEALPRCDAALGAAGQAHRRARHRHAVRTVELGRDGRRAARRHGRLARPRHPRRDAAALPLPGLSAERRDRGLRRRTGVRHQAAACATSSISTSARSPAAASCSTAASISGAHRQCRRARLDAGARAGGKPRAADRRRLAGDAGEAAARTPACGSTRSMTRAAGLGRVRRAELDEWIATAARGLAHAIVAAVGDHRFRGGGDRRGHASGRCTRRLFARSAPSCGRHDLSGIRAAGDLPRQRRPVARALGGASLPLFERYLSTSTPRSAPAPPGAPDKGPLGYPHADRQASN